MAGFELPQDSAVIGTQFQIHVLHQICDYFGPRFIPKARATQNYTRNRRLKAAYKFFPQLRSALFAAQLHQFIDGKP